MAGIEPIPSVVLSSASVDPWLYSQTVLTEEQDLITEYKTPNYKVKLKPK